MDVINLLILESSDCFSSLIKFSLRVYDQTQFQTDHITDQIPCLCGFIIAHLYDLLTMSSYSQSVSDTQRWRGTVMGASCCLW